MTAWNSFWMQICFGMSNNFKYADSVIPISGLPMGL